MPTPDDLHSAKQARQEHELRRLKKTLETGAILKGEYEQRVQEIINENSPTTQDEIRSMRIDEEHRKLKKMFDQGIINEEEYAQRHLAVLHDNLSPDAKDEYVRAETRNALEVLKAKMDESYFRLIKGKIERATEHSAAFDLFYVGENPVYVTDIPVPIPTGVFTEFSPGYVAIIKEKSGLALKGVEVKGGVIDADYRDEWKVILRCPLRSPMKPGDDTFYRINPGDKIAQFIMVALPKLLYKADEGAFVITKDSKREGGFGSTGK